MFFLASHVGRMWGPFARKRGDFLSDWYEICIEDACEADIVPSIVFKLNYENFFSN